MSRRWEYGTKKPAERRPGDLAVWWHRRGPRGGDHPEAIDVLSGSMMGARAIERALKREPDIYHAIMIVRWNGHRWLTPPTGDAGDIAVMNERASGGYDHG